MARHDPPEDKAVRFPPQDKGSARWICPRCGAANVPAKIACRRCGLARPPREPVPA